MTIVRFASLLFLILPLVVAGGCGDGRGVRIPISGVVTVDGQPLQHGSVTFNPIKGAEQKEKQRVISLKRRLKKSRPEASNQH